MLTSAVGQSVAFLGAGNKVHWLKISSLTNSTLDNSLKGEDRLVVMFSTDAPDDIEPMRLAAPMTNQLSGSVIGNAIPYLPPSPFRYLRSSESVERITVVPSEKLPFRVSMAFRNW